jgi:hypothetical protein
VASQPKPNNNPTPCGCVFTLGVIGLVDQLSLAKSGSFQFYCLLVAMVICALLAVVCFLVARDVESKEDGAAGRASDDADGGSFPPLFQAILAQNLSEIRSLVGAGANPNELWNGHMTSLGFAVSIWRSSDTEEQKIKVCAELIRLGANVNIPNGLGATPLDDATMGGKSRLAHYLRQQGGEAQMNPSGLSDAQVNSLMSDPNVQRLVNARHSPGGSGSGSGSGPVLVSLFIALALLGATGFALVKYDVIKLPASTPPAAEKEKDPARDLLTQAETLLRQRKFAEARTVAVEALEKLKDPKDRLAARYLIGVSALQAKDVVSARQEAKILLKAEPQNKAYQAFADNAGLPREKALK